MNGLLYCMGEAPLSLTWSTNVPEMNSSERHCDISRLSEPACARQKCPSGCRVGDLDPKDGQPPFQVWWHYDEELGLLFNDHQFVSHHPLMYVSALFRLLNKLGNAFRDGTFETQVQLSAYRWIIKEFQAGNQSLVTMFDWQLRKLKNNCLPQSHGLVLIGSHQYIVSFISTMYLKCPNHQNTWTGWCPYHHVPKVS